MAARTAGIDTIDPVNNVPPAGFDPHNVGRTFMGHPPGLFLLFFVEMWERFSYYGMRAILVLYLIGTFAAYQLAPGTYSDKIAIQEIVEVKGQSKPDVLGAAVMTATIAVGDESAIAPGVQMTGAPLRIQIQPLQKSQNQAAHADQGVQWEPVPNAVLLPPMIHGESGDKASFGDAERAYQLLNPTDAPIKVRVEVERDEGDPRTYFTVNDSPESVDIEVKPDSQRAEGESPARIFIKANLHDSGRNWSQENASKLMGIYGGLAYLFPILGGLIADRLIGTHRSMLVGGLLIAIGHVILGISGFGELAYDSAGMSLFMMGLAVIILGTGHFKPTVSVMVGQLYPQGDPRRDGAFTIFYMGINLGAFLCTFVVGTLGENVGWHWGFGSAAVGMIAGLLMYMIGKPLLLNGVGEAPRRNASRNSWLFLIGALAVSGLFAFVYYRGDVARVGEMVGKLQENHALWLTILGLAGAAVLGGICWFIGINRREDRGPVITIFVFLLFNAFFWAAFEQAATSLNVFTQQNTDRVLLGYEIPATWFQSVNAFFILAMAPAFSVMWTSLSRKKMSPSQPSKIAYGLFFLGLGYIFMVIAGKSALGGQAKASMWLIVACYFLHTVGELFLSPTGLSYVTKAAPVRFVSLLMGTWFVSSAVAYYAGGLVASKVTAISKGEIRLPWQNWGMDFGGQADFFFLFVVTSIGAGVVIFLMVPLLKKLMRNPND